MLSVIPSTLNGLLFYMGPVSKPLPSDDIITIEVDPSLALSSFSTTPCLETT